MKPACLKLMVVGILIVSVSSAVASGKGDAAINATKSVQQRNQHLQELPEIIQGRQQYRNQNGSEYNGTKQIEKNRADDGELEILRDLEHELNKDQHMELDSDINRVQQKHGE